MRFGFILISALFYYISDGISESNRYVSQEKKTLQASISDGKEIYQEFCVTCHLSNGKGTPGSVPPLAGSDWLSNKRKDSIHAVKYGQSGPIVVNGKNYNNTMPPMGLTDEEVADVMNYVMNSWGNKQKKQLTNGEVFTIKK
jgi:mono/diheme cytochrome c family protein